MNIQNILLNSPYFIRLIIINLYGLFLSINRFNKHFLIFSNKLQQNLLKSREDIQEEQFENLKSYLLFCYETVPYYKKLFDEIHFDPKSTKSFKDIEVIPYLTKEIIKKEGDNLLSSSSKSIKKIKHYTSGTTGEKLKFYLPKNLYYAKNTAFIYRFYSFYGVKPKDKRVTIGGRIITKKPPYWAINFFENQLIISSHHLNDENLPAIIKRIQNFKPVFIQGHPSAILAIAEYIEKHKVNLYLKLNAIFTTGETLSKTNQAFISNIFNCPVAQQYGSGESCFSAQQAPGEDAYLLNYEHGYVELVGSNDIKEVVVTSLQNNVMPFVRYKIGDLAMPSKKKFSKTHNLPIIFEEVIGRVDDIIKINKDKTVLPVTIRMAIKPLLKPGTSYQIIQIEKLQFRLLIVDPEKILNTKKIIQTLETILGKNVDVALEYTDNLITKGGKIRNIIGMKNI